MSGENDERKYGEAEPPRRGLDGETLLDVIPDLVFRIDHEGRFLDFQANDDGKLYVPRGAIVGRALRDMMPPEVAEQGLHHIARALCTGEAQAYEYRLQMPQGVLSFEARMVASGPDEVLSLVRDVTERKRAEEALRQRSAVIENSIDGMAFLDEDGSFVYLNEAHAKLYGYDGPEDLLGKGWDVLYDEEQLAYFHRHTMPALREHGHWRGEAVGRRPDGSSFPQELSISALKGGGFVCVVRDVTERKEAEQSLEESRRWLAEAQKVARLGIWEWNVGSGKVAWSEEQCRIHGLKPHEFGGTVDAHFERVHPDDRGIVRGSLERTLHLPGPVELENRITRPDGEVRMVHTRRQAVRDERGEPIKVVGTTLDVTERKRAEEALRESEERFRLLFEQSVDYLVVHDAAGNVVDASAETCRSLGYSRQEMLSMHVGDYEANLLSPEEREERERQGGTLWQRIVANEPGAVTEVLAGEHRRKDGTTFPVEVRVGGVVYGGERMILASSRDVTERKALEERLEYQAFHDPLTGLPNRALLMDRLEHALARASRDDGGVAVLFLDLDDFKVVNDSLGHEAGDKLLVEVAGRVRGCLRPGDTAARLGGDEFAVLLEGVAGVGEALRVAGRIGDALGTPVSLGARESHEARADASVGVALGHPGQRAGDLLRNADVAMYGAKARGKARHELFDPAMNERAASRLEAENGLRRAIGRGEIVAHYQPKVSLGDGAIVGVEALARWEDPERGLVLPAEFIPLAEGTGLIVPLGESVLRQACRRATAWREEHVAAPPVVVWVNLSPKQFHRADVVEQVSTVLRETGLDPGCLGLEITEGVAMDDAESTIETLERLKGLGVGIAIDDFGTGYSSLSYLKRFPVDVLKIDRSFVSGIPKHPEDLAIAQSVITLGRSLGMEVVAEGVETEVQLDRLRILGCDVGQGYHFARPMPAEEAKAFLAARRALR